MDAFFLTVNHDELEAKVVTCEISSDCIRSKESLMEQLREENVVKGVMHDAIDEAFLKLDTIEETGVEFLIAQGKRPKLGENGRVDFLVDVSGKAVFEKSKDETGVIDFKNATHVIAVKEGDHLATIIPPTEGTPGYSMTGKEIAARSGKTPMFRAGEGVEIDSDGKTVRAIKDGRPIFAHHVLSVSAVYEVSGDVSYETGNIKFNGHVLVHGNVQDEFSVEARSIEIQGVIGASKIDCKEDLIVRGGINGHDKAEILVGGDAFVKYVNQGHLEVRGELHVNREIVNSRVWCRSKVIAKKIVGGECLALQGIQSHIFGSEIGVPTLIEPGINYEVRRIEQAMDVLSRHIQRTIKPVTTFFGDRARYLALPNEKKAEFLEIYRQFSRLRAAYKKLIKGRRKLRESGDFAPVREVVVLGRLYQDVTIRSDHCIKLFRIEVGGPAAIVEDGDAGSFKVVSYVPGKGIVEEEEEEAAPKEEAKGAMSAEARLRALGKSP